MNNFDSKIRPLTRKMIYVSVLLSNHFWTHRHPKRERERERESVRRESRESELDCAPTPDVLARACLRDHVVKIALVRSCLQDRAAEIVPLRFVSSSFGLDHRRQDRAFDFWIGSDVVAALSIASSSFGSDHFLLISSSAIRRSTFSLWSLIFLLLLWWCGWWWFGGFCVVWWWVLCG